MKGTKIIFAVCLALLGIGDVWANESDDAVRAATRRGATNTVTTTRQKSNTPDASANTIATSRITNAMIKQSQPLRERTTVPRINASTTPRTANRNVAPRTTTNTSSRTASSSRTTITQTPARSASVSRTATRTPTTKARTHSTHETLNRAAIARNANNNTANLRDMVINSNARECREVYYNCMDEFCANKDSQLKRCACSSRLHEFDNVKKQLETAEEKMLDFSQRLLTVSMDAEDAAALNIATEGELAFNQKDTSESKKILDEITKKLNTKFDDDSFDRNLTAISLSLNEDAAFDNIDSLMGASTALKTGTALYGAALPVCREMAAEVCTPEQLSIAESGYQMMIEQDCNTVKKSYQSQTDAARAKILENSALLDMSRLSTYQDKNSDDILTCKRKMLDMLSDTSVCGTNMTKCLDMTGQYIDPSTGEAFLTNNLANLGKLITRPTANMTWTDMPGNQVFAEYLYSKKTFLEPAMEHCQDIADFVWTDFIEDALAQIKLAQDAKLEQVRQSCTTLTAQCLSDTAKSLTDFDARALSTFGVIADTTVNAMCADVKNACTALMETTGDGQTDWAGGITEIATDTTYDTILKTCREVGRACIIQACKSVSGNFGLCENIETSINRKAIINGTSCWQEVVDCVADAGSDSIDRVIAQLAERGIINNNKDDTATPMYSFYNELYGTDASTKWTQQQCITSRCYEKDGNGQDTTSIVACDNTNNTPVNANCVYDICTAKGQCTKESYTSNTCKTCRIAERIWGHCEAAPSTQLNDNTSHNKIREPINPNDTTLLYWFAQNTGTVNMLDSCRDTTCGPGEKLYNGVCYPSSQVTTDGIPCPNNKFTITDDTTNCCKGGKFDKFGNCCDSNTSMFINNAEHASNVGYYNEQMSTSGNTPAGNTHAICVPSDTTNAVHVATFTPTNGSEDDKHILICLGDVSSPDTGKSELFPSGDTITCSGQFMAIDGKGKYYNPDQNDTTFKINNYYNNEEGNKITASDDLTDWKIEFNQ